jgi:hypothetical protein
MSQLEQIYLQKCEKVSDINQHLPTLKRYSDECNHITEMGVRWVVSTYAFMMGKPKKLISIDIDSIEKYGISVDDLENLALDNGIEFEFVIADTRKIEIDETDLLFIDTYHVYEQLKIELNLHGNKAKKYIIMHDTEERGERGQDGGLGLNLAINEFISENPHWTIHEYFPNCCGLTVLKRN